MRAAAVGLVQPRKVGPSVGPEGDQFAVDAAAVGKHERQLFRVREQVGVVLAAAADQADCAAYVRDDAVAIPLHLERERGALVLAERDVTACGRGGKHGSKRALVRGLVAHQLEQPVLPLGANERVAARDAAQAPVAATVEHGDDLVCAPLFDVACADVPDVHRPRAVLALRDGAFEFGILNRMVLGLHGEAVRVGFQRWPLRHGPGDQHAVVLEPEIPVQVRGVVLADDEDGFALAWQRRSVGHRLAGLALVAHGAVRGQLVVPVGAKVRHRIEPARDPFHDLLELELAYLRVLDFVPRPRRGDGGPLPPPQRVRADGGLLPVVLAPVQEDLSFAPRLRHVGGHPARVRALQVLRQRLGHLGHGVRVACPVQARVEVNALGPGRHRDASQPHVLEDLAAPQGHLGGVAQLHAGPGV